MTETDPSGSNEMADPNGKMDEMMAAAEDPDVSSEAPQRTVTVEIVLDDVHATATDKLEQGGVDVEQLLSQNLQPQAEEILWQTLQQGKYQQQG